MGVLLALSFNKQNGLSGRRTVFEGGDVGGTIVRLFNIISRKSTSADGNGGCISRKAKKYVTQKFICKKIVSMVLNLLENSMGSV